MAIKIVASMIISVMLDLVQGPFLVHYDSMRVFPSRRELRVQNPDCYKMHSFIVSKTPKVETCEQVYCDASPYHIKIEVSS